MAALHTQEPKVTTEDGLKLRLCNWKWLVVSSHVLRWVSSLRKITSPYPSLSILSLHLGTYLQNVKVLFFLGSGRSYQSETGKSGFRPACHLPDPISRDRGWVFMGALFRWPVIWEDGRLCAVRDLLTFPFKPAFFTRGQKCREGIWNLGKRLIRYSCSWSVSWHPFIRWPSLSVSGWFPLSVSWAADCVSLEHNGSDATLVPYGLFWSTKVNPLWSPGVRVGRTCSSWNHSFLHAWTMRLINYYLKLKFSNSQAPHQEHSPTPDQRPQIPWSLLLLC